MNSIAIILFFLAFLVVQQGIDAINCYTCTYGTDGCGKSFSKTGAGVVPGNDGTYAACIKDVYSTNDNAISRSGGATCTASTTGVGPGTTFTRYCCTTELCNGAPMQKANFIFAIIIAMIGLLLIK